MATKTPAPLTASGADPFAGAPGDSNPAPADPTSVAMPTFTGGGGSSSKTFGGIPTSQFPTSISVPGYHPPGAADYVGDQSGPSTIPAYQDGDQWAPASDPNPDTVRSLQLQMIQAGLLTLAKTHLGVWDAYSANAYAKVLAQANVQGVPASTALDNYVQSEASLPKAQLSPDDLKAIANQTAQSFLGRDLSDAELAQFSTAFSSALAVDNPQTSAGTQQVAEDTLKKENPKGVMAASLHAVSQRALSVLSQPAVSLPSVQ